MPTLGFAATSFTLLPDEDPRAFHCLIDDLMAAWGPSGFLQTDLVERIAVHRWRLKRAMTLEARLAAAALDEASAVKHATALGRYIGGIERSIRELQKELVELAVEAVAFEKMQARDAVTHEQLKGRRLAREAALAAVLAEPATPATSAELPDPPPPARPMNRAERRRQQALSRQPKAA